MKPPIERWWKYQADRFPIVSHGLLVAAFSFSTVCYSLQLRGAHGLPPLAPILVAFATAFLFFLQLRIADEYKDYEEDARYRPYRPVPHGLVNLRELGQLAAAGALLQAALAWWLTPRLILPLLLVWAYLGCMTVEFFVGEWIRARPWTYLWTHMLIMPLIAFYVTSCDWLVARVPPPFALIWFLLASFLNGTVLEIGRKIRVPNDEEPGVETYTVLWGCKKAPLAWLAALCLAAAVSSLAARELGVAVQVAWPLAVMLAVAGLTAACFIHRPSRPLAKRIDTLSGIWTLLVYLSLGLVPLLTHNF